MGIPILEKLTGKNTFVGTVTCLTVGLHVSINDENKTVLWKVI